MKSVLEYLQLYKYINAKKYPKHSSAVYKFIEMKRTEKFKILFVYIYNLIYTSFNLIRMGSNCSFRIYFNSINKGKSVRHNDCLLHHHFNYKGPCKKWNIFSIHTMSTLQQVQWSFLSIIHNDPIQLLPVFLLNFVWYCLNVKKFKNALELFKTEKTILSIS